MTSQEFADLMTARGYDVRPEPGGWRTVCPAHGGTDRNMTIRSHSEGGVICTCHSHHCSRRAIVEALGLTTTDMVSPQARNVGSKGNQSDGSNTFRGNVAPIVYPYRDEAGKVLYEIVRTVGLEGKKTFAMRLPGAERGGVGDVRRVLFGLPELLLTQPGEVVCIAEGEKCAMAVAIAGLAATTNPNGAGKWRPEYTAWLTEHLPGRRFLVLADNDLEGKKHAVAVGDSLEAAGLEVYLADLGTLPAKGDVVQWLAAGGTAEKLQAMAAPAAPKIHRWKSVAALMAREFPPVRWAVQDVLPEGLAIFAGPSKSCKSWLCVEMCIAVACGGRVFGQIQAAKGSVCYYALEDSERRIKSRFETMLRGEPAPAGITYLTEAPRVGEGFEEEVVAWLQAHPDARLIIIDVLQRVRPPKQPGITEYEQDYAALSSLQKICSDYRVPMLIVHHTRKATADDPYDMISGSTALTGCADTLWALMRLRNEEEATLHYTGRDVDADALALRWDKAACGWVMLGKAVDHRLTGERRQVLEFLRQATSDVKPSEIAGVLGKNPAAIQYLMGQLVDEGLITKSFYGKYCMTEVQKKML